MATTIVTPTGPTAQAAVIRRIAYADDWGTWRLTDAPAGFAPGPEWAPRGAAWECDLWCEADRVASVLGCEIRDGVTVMRQAVTA